MQCLVQCTYCCNRNISSVHATAFKKLAWKLISLGNQKAHGQDTDVVQGTAAWAFSRCLEPAAGLCFCVSLPAGRALRGVPGLVKCSFDGDAVWVAPGSRASLLVGIMMCSCPLLNQIWAWRVTHYCSGFPEQLSALQCCVWTSCFGIFLLAHWGTGVSCCWPTEKLASTVFSPLFVSS